MLMDADEKEIYNFLKTFGEHFVAAREICRRAGGKKRWRENPQWALPFLPMMVDKEILESDSTAHYRIKQEAKKKKEKQWISPHIKRILERGGLDPSAPGRVEPDPVTVVIPED